MSNRNAVRVRATGDRRIRAVRSPGRWAGLELRHLLALKAIAEHGSFHRAAAALDYTQSGISHQIAALERIVGERLLERPGGSRPVRLTEVGRRMLAHSRLVLDQVDAAQADVAALQAGAAGQLRVGAFQSVGAKLLPPLMSRLPRIGLQIELTQTTSDPELFDLLADGRLDVTFAMLPAPEGPFRVRELFAERFIVLAAADSEVAGRGRPLSLSELAELPLIAAHACRYTGQLEVQLRERGFEPNVVHRSDDNGTVHGLVAAGAGVAFVPRLVADAVNGELAVLEVDEHLPPRRIALASRRDRPTPAALDTFVEEVVATCDELGLTAASR
jgi:DNA-binding transcriptional LysR family regulator